MYLNADVDRSHMRTVSFIYFFFNDEPNDNELRVYIQDVGNIFLNLSRPTYTATFVNSLEEKKKKTMQFIADSHYDVFIRVCLFIFD